MTTLSDIERDRLSGDTDDTKSLPELDDIEMELSYVKGQAHEWHDATFEARERSCRDRDYYDGDQWTEEQVNILEDRDQPVITFNRIAPKVDYVLGTEIDSRKQPRAHAKRPDTETDADAATDAIRYKVDECSFEQQRSNVGGEVFVEGAGGCLIVPDARDLKQARDFSLQTVWFKNAYWDPKAREKDYSDALYMGIVKWMVVADAKAMFNTSEAHYAIDHSMNQEELQDDVAAVRPAMWSRREQTEVQVFQHWVQAPDPKTGMLEWYECVFVAGGFLEKPSKVQWYYLDHQRRKRTWCPLQLCSGKIKSGSSDTYERYGVVRNMIGPQDEINHRRTKAIHDLHSRKVIYEEDVFPDPEGTRDELHKPDAMVPVPVGTMQEERFRILDNMTEMQGQVQMLQDAKAEIDQTGPRPMAMPEGSTRLSGRLFIAQAEVSAREMRPLFDNLKDWTLRMYTAMWRAIQQLWTYDMWLAIEEQQDVYRFVGLNQTTTRGARLKDLMAHQVPLQKSVRMAFGPRGKQIFQQAAQQVTLEAQQAMQLQQQQGVQLPPPDSDRLQRRAVDIMAASEMGQEILTYNDVANIDVDIKLEEAPNSVLIQHEQFTEIIGLMREQLLPTSPELLKLVIEMSSFSNKQRLINIIAKPPDPKVVQQQQQIQQLEQQRMAKSIELLTAQVQKLQAEAAKQGAQAQLQAAKVQTEPHEAHLLHAQAQKLEAETSGLPTKNAVHLAQAELDRARADAVPAEVAVKQQLARNASGDKEE